MIKAVGSSCRERMMKAVILVIALLVAPITQAQESTIADEESPKVSAWEKIKDFTLKSVDFVDHLLNETDSTYISQNEYNMSVYPMYAYSYEHYRFSSTGKKQSITIAPDSRNKLGVYVGWRWLSIGYSIDLQDSHPYTDFNISLYASRMGIDLFYRKSSEGYKIRSLSGFYENDEPLQNYNNNFDGLTVKQKGLNLYYIFDKRFSYPAAYSQSEIQRISAGSFILGVNYNEQEFSFDYTGLDQRIQEQLNPELKFKEIMYKDFSINFGYSYNWVFAKNFLASISLTPAIGYKNTSLKLLDSKSLLSSINFDFITRAALVYNNKRYYAGASLVSHAYFYNKSRLSLINGFGVVKVFLGFNFWRKK